VVGGRSWKVIRHLSGPKRDELQLAHQFLVPYQMPRSWPLQLIPGVPSANQFRTHVVRFSEAPSGLAQVRSRQVLEYLRRGWSDAHGDRIKTLTINCYFRIADVVQAPSKADKQMFFADNPSLPLVEDLNLANLKAFAREIQPNTRSLTIRASETFVMPLERRMSLGLHELMCDFDWSCFQNLHYLEISCCLPTGVQPNAFMGTSEERRLQGYTNLPGTSAADSKGFSRWSTPPLRAWTPDPLLPHYTGPRIHLRTLTLWLYPSPFQREVSPSHILSSMTSMPHIRNLASTLMEIVDENCVCTVKLGRFVQDTLVVENDTHLTMALREQMALVAGQQRMLPRTSSGPYCVTRVYRKLPTVHTGVRSDEFDLCVRWKVKEGVRGLARSASVCTIRSNWACL
jgi:hypothetical protein